MKVYIAGKFNTQGPARIIRDWLEFRGHRVTSTWLNQQGRAKDDETAAQFAARDLSDIRRCDTMLFLTKGLDGPTQGGMWVELGYAIALNKRVLVFGQYIPSNIFLRNPDIKYLPRLKDAF